MFSMPCTPQCNVAAVSHSVPIAGLRELDVTMFDGWTDMHLSCKWAALEHLTRLSLSGIGVLRQYPNAREGALHHLFQHLVQAYIQVGCLSQALCMPRTEIKGWIVDGKMIRSL